MLSNKNVQDRPNEKEEEKNHLLSSPCFSETSESWIIISLA